MGDLLASLQSPAARAARRRPGAPSCGPRLRVLIADDEADARERLRDHLAAAPDVVVVGECGDTAALADLLAATSPDVAFLDIQMPGGPEVFAVLGEADPERLPVVVFVTAYEQHALRAFGANALDYVLKPFAPERLQAALRRARDAVRQRRGARLAAQLGELAGALASVPHYADRLPVRRDGRVGFVRTADIEWVDAARNAVRLNGGGWSHVVRAQLGEIERRLDPRKFVRIHRSTLVNVDKIKELRLTPQGGYVAVVDAGRCLTISRSYRDALDRLLGEAP